MKTRLTLLACVVMLSGIRPTQSAEFERPTDLLPASVIGYIETHKVGDLARELSKITKGSTIENIHQFIAEARTNWLKKQGNPYMPLDEELAVMGMMFGPEVLEEAQKVQGAAVAWTEMDEDAFALVILPGESRVPALLFKMLISMENLIVLDKVEGVTIYGDRRESIAIAMTSDVLTMGNSILVKDVIRRAKGKSADPALSSMGFYKREVKLRKHPGVYGGVSIRAMLAPLERQTFRREVPSLWLAMLQPFDRVSGGIGLEKGTLTANVTLTPQIGSTHKLFGVLPTKKGKFASLNVVPNSALASVSVDLTDGEKQYKNFLQLIDGMMGSVPKERLLSTRMSQIEKQFNIDLSKWFSKLQGAGYSYSPPRKGEERHSVIFQMVDEQAAKDLVEAAPKLINGLLLNGRGNGRATLQELDNQNIIVYDLGRFGISYQRRGSTVIFSPTPSAVAEALQTAKVGQSVLARKDIQTTLKELDNPILLSTVNLPEFFFLTTNMVNRLGPTKTNPFWQKVNQQLSGMPPTIICLSREKNTFHLRATQSGLTKHFPKVVNLIMTETIEAAMKRRMRNGSGESTAPVPRNFKDKQVDEEKPRNR